MTLEAAQSVQILHQLVRVQRIGTKGKRNGETKVLGMILYFSTNPRSTRMNLIKKSNVFIYRFINSYLANCRTRLLPFETRGLTRPCNHC